MLQHIERGIELPVAVQVLAQVNVELVPVAVVVEVIFHLAQQRVRGLVAAVVEDAISVQVFADLLRVAHEHIDVRQPQLDRLDRQVVNDRTIRTRP
ncbi:hypothetical protein D3C83_04860 [compost metagenome]